MALNDYLGEQCLGVLASYQPQGIVHHIGVVYPPGAPTSCAFSSPRGISWRQAPW